MEETKWGKGLGGAKGVPRWKGFCQHAVFLQVRKTLDATMQTLQDMLTVEDFDVSDAFQHSRSTESVKSAASETYMSKINIAKRRANQQETEMFYFTVSGLLDPELTVC